MKTPEEFVKLLAAHPSPPRRPLKFRLDLGAQQPALDRVRDQVGVRPKNTHPQSLAATRRFV